jgi:hypothetical protein
MVPLSIRGTLRNPKVTVDAAGAAGEAARLAAGASDKAAPLAGIIIGALGADRMIAGGERDNCAQQLAIARGGRPGPLPAALPASGEPAPGKPKLPNAGDLLRQFLR